MMKSPIVHLSQIKEIREISQKYKNEEDRRCLDFYNYGSD